MRDYHKNIQKSIQWINGQMLTFDNGYYGIYERIRIDEHIRTNWSRPDCNAEYLRLLCTYQKLTGSNQYNNLIVNIFNWMRRTQDTEELSVWKGSFPFYVIDGYIREPKVGESIYQNDNGKILVCLCQLYKLTQNKEYLQMAEAVAGYWIKTQQQDGTFGVKDGKNTYECRKGPCFIQWLAIGLFMLSEIIDKPEYLYAATKGMEYLISNIMEDGRSRTTYEIIKMEDWRPLSSETGNTLYALSVGYKVTRNPLYLKKQKLVLEYQLSLLDESGAILNCKPGDEQVSQQNNPDLCDLVYTAGFTLQAFIWAYETTGEQRCLDAAYKLGDFLASVQCNGESELWDGGFRGSYDVKSRKWSGRANQNNPIDEGGMYSVYTGWCCTNIIYGLILLQGYSEGEELL